MFEDFLYNFEFDTKLVLLSRKGPHDKKKVHYICSTSCINRMGKVKTYLDGINKFKNDLLVWVRF